MILKEKYQNNLKSVQLHIFTFQHILHLLRLQGRGANRIIYSPVPLRWFRRRARTPLSLFMLLLHSRTLRLHLLSRKVILLLLLLLLSCGSFLLSCIKCCGMWIQKYRINPGLNVCFLAGNFAMNLFHLKKHFQLITMRD